MGVLQRLKLRRSHPKSTENKAIIKNFLSVSDIIMISLSLNELKPKTKISLSKKKRNQEKI